MSDYLFSVAGTAGVSVFFMSMPTPCCSFAFSRISSVVAELGVEKLVANEKTMIAIANPQVRRSSKSPVFLTPIRLLAPDPPNWLESPPPFEFWAKTTKTNRTELKIARLINKIYILTS